jgi:cell wall-associated NlpC family hydrolase
MRGPKATATLLSLAALAAPCSALAANTGGVAPPPKGSPSSGGSTTGGATTGGAQYTPGSGATTAPGTARLDAGVAYAPPAAPIAVVRAIRAGNRLQDKPYLYGGGHKSFKSAAYDCSGAVSYALHGGGLLTAPLNSSALMAWGTAGPGSWITVYANPGHAYAVIAGLRLDTSGTGGRGPRWQLIQRDATGFVARHPAGL